MSGEADLCFNQKLNLSYDLENPHYEELKITTAFALELDTCIASCSGDNEMLMSIIDEGLGQITEHERNYILMDFTLGNTYELTFSDIIYKYRFTFSILALLMFCILASVLGLFVSRQVRIQKIRKVNIQLLEALEVARQAGEAKGILLRGCPMK